MKVRCVNNDACIFSLTVNKVYDVVDECTEKYKIKDDIGDLTFYYKERFELVDEPLEETKTETTPPPKSLIHKKICDELNSIYEKKNSDYGDSFGKSFIEYGMTMPCIRLEDKLLRLKSLTVNKKDQQVNDESIEDTLLDLANYAIMSLIEMRGNKNEE